MTERQAQSLEQESRFLFHINNIVGISQDCGSSAVVVGGIALRAYMDQPVQYRRPNGTIPDIDMIGLGPNLKILKRTKEEISKYKKSALDCPSVGLELVRFSDKPKEIYSPLEFLSGLRRDHHGEYYLTFRGVDQPIPYQTMDVFPLQYGSAKILTLPKETILHRYETIMGYIKPKDELKIKEFKNYIENNGGIGLNEDLYQSYVDFCRRVNEKYPNVIKLTKFFWNLDLKHKGKISGSSGFVYDLTKLFRR